MFTFAHKLGLALRLLDAATGQTILLRGGQTLLNGVPLHPFQREDGYWVFHRFPPQGGVLTVRLPEYEPFEFRVDPRWLNAQLPILSLPLIPARGLPFFCTLRGCMAGLTAIDAVNLNESGCLVRGFDSKKQVLTLFNHHRLMFDCLTYALLGPEAGRYEAIEITEQADNQSFRLAEPPRLTPDSRFTLVRRVIGSAARGGDYLLRVQNGGAGAQWLIRFQRSETESFEIANFSEPASAQFLAPHAAEGRDI